MAPRHRAPRQPRRHRGLHVRPHVIPTITVLAALVIGGIAAVLLATGTFLSVA